MKRTTMVGPPGYRTQWRSTQLDSIDGAVEFALAQHEGQFDRSGHPYILHPLRVGASLFAFGANAVITGLLHDVVEDCGVQIIDLELLGASPDIRSGVRSVTGRPLPSHIHSRTQEHLDWYAEDVRRAMADPLGRVVKPADVLDNAGRIDTIEDASTAAWLTLKATVACTVIRETHPHFRLGMKLRP